MSDNFLKHYGTKGMKWGIRKKSGSSKSSTKKTTTTLTNKELKKRVDRLNMEKRYSELSKEKKRTKMSKGKQIVTDVVETFGNEYPKQFGKKAGKRGAGLTVNILGDIIEKKVKA